MQGKAPDTDKSIGEKDKKVGQENRPLVPRMRAVGVFAPTARSFFLILPPK